MDYAKMAKYKVTHKRKMVNLTCMGKLYKRKRVTWDVKAPVLPLMFGALFLHLFEGRELGWESCF